MSETQQRTIRALLEALSDSSSWAEPLLHGAVRLTTHPPATLADFETALKFAEEQHWVRGTTGRLGNRRWVISDDGILALPDL